MRQSERSGAPGHIGIVVCIDADTFYRARKLGDGSQIRHAEAGPNGKRKKLRTR